MAVKKEKYSVYILKCGDGSLYTGITNNLDERLKKHSTGKASKYTRSKLPVRCIYSEIQPDMRRARQREAEIKSWKRSDKIALIMDNRNS